MRVRTAAVVGVLLVFFGGAAVLGLGGTAAGGDLTETWVSDTARENTVNHHAVGVGPASEVVVAPVTEVPNLDAPITDTSCSLAGLEPSTGETLWRAGVPPTNCSTHAFSQPAIGDVDDDGAREVYATTTEHALLAYDAQSGEEEWRVSLGSIGYGQPTIADVTPAPGPEIVASDIDGEVVVARGNGSVAWRTDLNRSDWVDPVVWHAPIVADVDADGDTEVLVGSNEGPAVLSASGEVEWRRDGSASYVTAVDVDDDPAIEVLTAGPAGVRAYDGETGDVEWSRSITNARVHAAADADGDGTVEVYVGGTDGTVRALDAATGETEWTTTLARGDGAIVPPPNLVDVSGDGTPEVIAVAETGTVSVLDPDTGEELAAYERDVPIWTFAAAGNLDDDPAAELLVRYGDGRVVALDYTAADAE